MQSVQPNTNTAKDTKLNTTILKHRITFSDWFPLSGHNAKKVYHNCHLRGEVSEIEGRLYYSLDGIVQPINSLLDVPSAFDRSTDTPF